MNATDWRPIVYAGAQVLHDLAPGIRGFVLRRDHCQCQGCGKRPTSNTELTIHHIIPRARGGSDATDNLRTLCFDCHDIAELECHGEEPTAPPQQQLLLPAPTEPESITAERVDWRRIVYGGYTLRPGDRL